MTWCVVPEGLSYPAKDWSVKSFTILDLFWITFKTTPTTTQKFNYFDKEKQNRIQLNCTITHTVWICLHSCSQFSSAATVRQPFSRNPACTPVFSSISLATSIVVAANFVVVSVVRIRNAIPERHMFEVGILPNGSSRGSTRLFYTPHSLGLGGACETLVQSMAQQIKATYSTKYFESIFWKHNG